MTNPIEIPLDDWRSHLLDPPIIDYLHYEPSIDSFVATFVPSDDVSEDEKESVTVPRNSHDGRRIQTWLTEIAKLIGNGRTIARLQHQGGGDFIFSFDNQSSYRLAESQYSNVITQRVYDGIRYISVAAETAFRIEVGARRRVG